MTSPFEERLSGLADTDSIHYNSEKHQRIVRFGFSLSLILSLTHAHTHTHTHKQFTPLSHTHEHLTNQMTDRNYELHHTHTHTHTHQDRTNRSEPNMKWRKKDLTDEEKKACPDKNKKTKEQKRNCALPKKTRSTVMATETMKVWTWTWPGTSTKQPPTNESNSRPAQQNIIGVQGSDAHIKHMQHHTTPRTSEVARTLIE